MGNDFLGLEQEMFVEVGGEDEAKKNWRRRVSQHKCGG